MRALILGLNLSPWSEEAFRLRRASGLDVPSELGEAGILEFGGNDSASEQVDLASRYDLPGLQSDVKGGVSRALLYWRMYLEAASQAEIGNWKRAEALCRDLLHEDDLNPSLLARVHYLAGTISRYNGQHQQGLLHLLEAKRLLAELELDGRLDGYVRIGLGDLAMSERDWDLAREYYEEALSLLTTLGETLGMVRAWRKLATLYLFLGDRGDKVERCLEQAKARLSTLEEGIQVKCERGKLDYCFGQMYYLRGDYRSGRRLLTSGLWRALELGIRHCVVRGLLYMAESFDRQGLSEEAGKWYQRAEGIQARQGDRLFSPERTELLSLWAKLEESYGNTSD